LKAENDKFRRQLADEKAKRSVDVASTKKLKKTREQIRELVRSSTRPRGFRPAEVNQFHEACDIQPFPAYESLPEPLTLQKISGQALVYRKGMKGMYTVSKVVPWPFALSHCREGIYGPASGFLSITAS
jgi:hypothetical protein